jgi:hypothetical protein
MKLTLTLAEAQTIIRGKLSLSYDVPIEIVDVKRPLSPKNN